jgi:Holliday junction resolvasome RuvABC endonuclease subunit
MKVLGLDPSLTGFGWALHDTEKAGHLRCIEWGEIKTPSNTLEVVRHFSIRNTLCDLIQRLNPEYIAMETPIFGSTYSEGMYALFVTSQQAVYLSRKDLVFFAVTQVKAHAREFLDYPTSLDMGKRQMMEAVRKDMGIDKLQNKEHNRADAYLIARMGARFWSLYSGLLGKSELTKYESEAFCRSHLFTKGAKKGQTENTGIIHREGERFHLWSRVENGDETIRADITIATVESVGVPRKKQSRKPRRKSGSFDADGVESTHSDGIDGVGLPDRGSP